MIISAKTNYMKSLLTDSPTTGINSKSIFRNIYGIKQNRMFTIGGPLITFHSLYEMEISLIPRIREHSDRWWYHNKSAWVSRWQHRKVEQEIVISSLGSLTCPGWAARETITTTQTSHQNVIQMLFPKPAGVLPSQLLTHEYHKPPWLCCRCIHSIYSWGWRWCRTTEALDKPKQPNSLIIICKCWQCWHTGHTDTATDGAGLWQACVLGIPELGHSWATQLYSNGNHPGLWAHSIN